MSYKLILFIDNDYIVPVVDNNDGNLKKFRQTEDLRLWLYFYDSPHKTGLDHGRSCKSNYESGQPGYYGNFWESVEREKPYSTHLAELPYCELLEHSGMLSSLKEFYNSSSGSKGDIVPTVYVFSDNISLAARKKFLKYMEEKRFEIISFSVSINDLIGNYILATRQSLNPTFGDKAIILQSSGKDLLMYYSTYDGNSFLTGEEPEKRDNIGDDPLKRGLVKFVVNKVDEQNNFLSEQKREKEYNYQMQFADQWLSQKKNEISFTIDNFHYSSDTEITYSCKVDCAYLRSIQEKAIGDTLYAIEAYKNRNTKNDLIQVVLVGDAFSNEFFQEKVIDRIGDSRKIIYLSVNDIPEVLNRYIRNYKSLEEKLSEFDSIFLDKKQIADSINAWVKSAQNIRLLQTEINDFEIKYKRALNEFSEKFAIQKNLWLLVMQSSDFAKAKEHLDVITNLSTGIEDLNIRKNDLNHQSDSFALIYSRINQFEGAKKITNNIEEVQNSIRTLSGQFNTLLSELDELKKRTEFYELNYPVYKEKLYQLKKERSYTIRKKLQEEIQQITMEELPVIEVEEDLQIQITAEIIKYGSFFSRKKKLNVKVKIQAGRKLPCRSVLLIAPRVMVKLNRDCSCTEDFDSGVSGTIEREFEFPISNCEKAKELYIYFWPHEDELVSINAFSTNKCFIKL